MPQPTSQRLKEDIIKLHILGTTNSKIAHSLQTSAGNVSNVIQDFKGKIDAGDYDSIRTFVALCKQKEIVPSQALDVVSTYSIFQKNGIDHENIQKFVNLYLKSAGNTDPSEIAKHSLELMEISEKTNTPLSEIPTHYDELRIESKTLESNIESLKTKEQEFYNETNKALKQRDLTEQALKEFDGMQKQLRLFRLDVDDHTTFAKMILQAKSENYNISEISQYISQEKSFDQRLLEKQKEISNLERKLKDYNEEIEKNKQKFSDTQNQLSNIQELYNEEKSAVNAIKRLEKSGITTAEIERWENTRKHYDDPVEFDEHLKDTKKHIDFILKLKNQTEQLKSENSKLQGEKSALDQEIKSKKIQLQTMDQRISKIIKDSMAELGLVVKKLTSHFASKLEYHDIAIRNRLDNSLKRFEGDLGQFLPTLDESLSEIMKIYGDQKRLEFLEPLYKIFKGEKVDQISLYHNMAQLLGSLELYIKTKGNYGLEISVRNLKNEFTKLLEKPITAF